MTLTFLLGALSGSASAGDGRGEIAVSAYVTAASSVMINIADAADAHTPAQSSAKSANSKSLCAAVAISCTNQSPMRVSVDGNPENVNGFQQCAASGRQNNLSLCASPENDSNRFGITIEY